MPECTYPSEGLSFDCIREIIARIRGQELSVELVRMIIKQVDQGLSLVGPRKPEDPSVELPEVTVQEYKLETLAMNLELAVEEVDLPGTLDVETQRIPVMTIIAILLEIFKVIQPILGSNPDAS